MSEETQNTPPTSAEPEVKPDPISAEDLTKLANEKAALARERDEYAKKLAEYQLKETKAQEEEEAQKRDELAKSGDAEKVKTAYQAKYDKDISALQEQNLVLQRQIVARDRDSVVADAITEHAMPGKEHVVKLLLKDRVKAKLGEDGKSQIVIHDEDGNISADSLKDLIKSLRNDDRNKEFFKAKTGRGGLSDRKPVDHTKPNPGQFPTPGSTTVQMTPYKQLMSESIEEKAKRHLAMASQRRA